MNKLQGGGAKITIATIMLWTAELAFLFGMLRFMYGLDFQTKKIAVNTLFIIWSVAVLGHIFLAAFGYLSLNGPDDQHAKDRRALSATVAWCIIPILVWMLGCLTFLDGDDSGINRMAIFKAAAAHLIPAAIAIRWQLHRDRGQIHSSLVRSCRLVSLLIGLMPTLIAMSAIS
jgi:hypothetical protein